MNVALIIFFIILTCGILGISLRLFRDYTKPKKVGLIKEQISQGKIALAVRNAKKLLTKNPRNCDAHYLLGKAYTKDGKRELALTEYKIVNQIALFSRICPEIDFRSAIASLYLEFGEEEEALKEFILLIALEPDNARFYYQAGRLFEARNSTHKAASYYKQAIKYNPFFSDAYSAYARMMYNMKIFAEAKSALLNAIKYNPDDYQAYFFLGRIYKDIQNYPNALVAFESALQDSALKISSLIERGICYYSMRDFTQAQFELEQAIQLATDTTDSNMVLHARYYLSICYEKKRNLDMAIEQWEIIDNNRKNFRDIPKRLQLYQALRIDDTIKDFLTATSQQFEHICRQLTKTMEHRVLSYKTVDEGALIDVENEKNPRSNNNKRHQKLFKFLRVPEAITQLTVRSFHEQMSKSGVNSGCFITSSDFTPLAKDYANDRQIELINGSRLRVLLEKMMKTNKGGL